MTLFPNNAQASERIHIETISIEVTNRSEKLTQGQIEALVARYSIKHGVSYDEMLTTVQCEAKKAFIDDTLYYFPASQSDLTYSFTDADKGIYEGAREESYGLAQIHRPSHPNVTKEQAQDKDFALNFMASEFEKGNQWKWTCWKNAYSNK